MAIFTPRFVRQLRDVLITTPTNGQVLAYESASSKWKNTTGGGGGSSTLIGLTDVTGTAGTGKAPVSDGAGAFPLTDIATQAELNALSSVYQPLDSDLTAIAALTTTSFGRSLLALADAAALLSAAGAQASDSDLTAIAALTTTSFGRSLLTLADAAALLAAAGAQASDSDLTAIAALSPSNDDVIQRKAGAWTNRTVAQLLVDLAAPGTTFQPLDSDLTSIAALATTSFGRGLLVLADAAALLAAAGAQASDATLTALAAANWAANALPIGTGADTLSQTAFAANTFPARASTGNLVAKAITDAGLALVDDADATAMRVTLGLVIGTNVQAFDAELAALAGLTSAADKLPYFTGSGTAALADLTSAARSVLDDTTTGAMLTTLGAAPSNATYITQVAESGLSGEQSLAALATGILKSTTTTGVLSIAAAGTDYYAPGSTDVAVADGGTGASTAAGARTNLGLTTRNLFLSGAGMYPSATAGCQTNTKTEQATNKQNVYTLDFDATTAENAEALIAMPADWDGGTVTAAFYWMASGTSTNSVVWYCQGRSYGDSETLDQAFGTLQQVTDAHTATAAQVMISAATPAITLGGTPAAGELVLFRVGRLPADGSDTLAVDAQLIGVMITYTRT